MLALETTARRMVSLRATGEVRTPGTILFCHKALSWLFYCPQNSIARVKLSDDIAVKYVVAEQPDVQDSGALA